MIIKIIIFFKLLLIIQACGGGGSESRSPSSSNSVSKDKPPAPPTGAQSQGVDPLYQHSWHLENTGQRTFSTNGGISGRDINVKEVYQNQIFGHQVKIAVSDNGVEISHPDLWYNHLSGQSRDYSNGPDTWLQDPYPVGSAQDDAHGTSVAGIISATKDNAIGSHGVAPYSSFAGFLFVGAPYSEAKYIDQAQGNFDIFNYSYGRVTCRFTILPEAYIAQLKYGVEVQRQGKGSLYVKAAGNEYVGPRSDCLKGSSSFYFGNSNLEHDHSTPYVIAVAALNARGEAASYSTPGSSLWVSAPGGEYGSSSPAIVTTDLQGCQRGLSQSSNETNNFEKGNHELNPNCDYTSTMNGTSSAAPVVTGVIALMLEANPDLTWREVKHILAATAKKVDPSAGDTQHPYRGEYNMSGHIYQYGWIENAAGYNFHNWYGFGGVDAKKAVEAAINYQSSFGNLIEREVSSPALNLVIPDRNPTGAESALMVNESFYIEAVQLRVTIEHGYASDLGIELESPSGTKSRLLNINSGIVEADLYDSLLLSNAFYGEDAQGEWKIRVWDGAEQDEGHLKRWKLYFYGHKGPSAHDVQAVTTSSQNGIGLGQLLPLTSSNSKSANQLTNTESSEQLLLKETSSNTRSLINAQTSGRTSRKVQMNSTQDTVPLSELLSWDQLKDKKVIKVYPANDKVVVLTQVQQELGIALFENDQFLSHTKLELGKLVFKEAFYHSSQHYLMFFTPEGDLEYWAIDEKMKVVKQTYPLQMKNKMAHLHHTQTDKQWSLIVEDQDFFHTLIYNPAGQIQRLAPVPVIESHVISVFYDEKQVLNVIISSEKGQEYWKLNDAHQWKSEQVEHASDQMTMMYYFPKTQRSVGMVVGAGLERNLGTHDIFVKSKQNMNILRQAGEEKLVQAIELENQDIIIFGHTNGSFKQSNFGEWDLFGIVFDQNLKEIERWHWGREQKTIRSANQQKLHYASVKELPEGALVRLWYTDDEEIRMMKFYLTDREISP